MKLLHGILFILTLQTVNAQVRFTKYPIGDSGCSAYFPAQPTIDVTYSEDSSVVYTTDITADSLSLGLICVKLSAGSVGTDRASNVALLKSYLDYLKGVFGIVGAVGYGEGHTLDSHPAADGVIDYWTDGSGFEWKIKGWVDNNFITVMYIHTGESYPPLSIIDIYLDGFRFPD